MIEIKTEKEIEIMREGGRILAGIMEKLGKEVEPGIKTEDLDRLAEELILAAGGKCSFKGYNIPDDSAPNRVYPSCLCTSVNEEIVHAIPSKRILKEGDIIKLDLGIEYKGFHNDMAMTFPVGRINLEIARMIETTRTALEKGILEVKPGKYIGDISKAIQKHIEGQGFSVVRELCGHGIGRKVHQDPEIVNAVSTDKYLVDKVRYQDSGLIKLREGMVICLEPMSSMGNWEIKKGNDGFGFITKDNSLSAHFEHTIAVIPNGHRVLTIV